MWQQLGHPRARPQRSPPILSHKIEDLYERSTHVIHIGIDTPPLGPDSAPPAGGPASCSPLRQDRLHHLGWFHPGEAEVEPLELVAELAVVDAEEVQEGRVEVVNPGEIHRNDAFIPLCRASLNTHPRPHRSRCCRRSGTFAQIALSGRPRQRSPCR